MIGELRSETAYPQLLIRLQPRTEQIFGDALQEEPAAEIRFSAEGTDLEQHDDRVTIPYVDSETTITTTAAFVADCDGAQSRVRETVANPFEGLTYSMWAVLADLRLDPDPRVRFPRLSRRRGVATAVRLDEHRWRLIISRPPKDWHPARPAYRVSCIGPLSPQRRLGGLCRAGRSGRAPAGHGGTSERPAGANHGGMSEGDRVVTHPCEQLSDGTRVEVR